MTTDTQRLDWLERNVSKLGMIPDWRWQILDENYRTKGKTKEFTDIRKLIDKYMEIENDE